MDIHTLNVMFKVSKQRNSKKFSDEKKSKLYDRNNRIHFDLWKIYKIRKTKINFYKLVYRMINIIYVILFESCEQKCNNIVSKNFFGFCKPRCTK